MRALYPDFAKLFLAQVRHSLLNHHLPRIIRCLNLLTEREIWWRPNRASNSVGNLVLHLAGNVCQWIISGLGGAPDIRQREKEFREVERVSRRALLSLLRKTVIEAAGVLGKLSSGGLSRTYSIQGFRVTGFEAVDDVAKHFAYHCGQIIYITKLKHGKDLAFTRLPGEKPKRRRVKELPALQVASRNP